MIATREPDLKQAIDAPVAELPVSAGACLRYYHDRSASGRPLVLIHSINAAPSAMEIKPLFEHYRSQRPVYAPDLPGFGLSTRGPLPYSPEFFADSIARFLREVVAEPADIVALSLSAEFAARACLLEPTLVRSLTLVSPTGLQEREPPGPDTVRKLRRLFGLPGMGGLYKVLTTRPSIRFFLDKAFVDKSPEPVVDYAWQTSHQRGASHSAFAFLSMGLFTPAAMTSLYAAIQAPTLVLYDQDPNVSFERLPALLQANSQCQAQRLAPSNGLPHWDETARCCATLDAFWAELESGNGKSGGLAA